MGNIDDGKILLLQNGTADFESLCGIQTVRKECVRIRKACRLQGIKKLPVGIISV